MPDCLRFSSADFRWRRTGIAAKTRDAFGILGQGFQRRPLPDAKSVHMTCVPSCGHLGLVRSGDARAPAPSPPGAPPPERTAQAGPASGARPGGLGASRRRRPAAGGGARVPPPSPAPHGDARARTASASAPRGRSVAGRPLGPPGGRAARPSRTPPHAKSECRRFVHSCCSLGVYFGSDALDSGGALQFLVYP